MTAALAPPADSGGDAAVPGRLDGTRPRNSCPLPGVARLLRAERDRLLLLLTRAPAAVPGRDGLNPPPVEAYGDTDASTRGVRGRPKPPPDRLYD